MKRTRDSKPVAPLHAAKPKPPYQIEQDFIGFYLLLRHYPDPVQKAAFSFIGTVVGYWLR